MTAQAAGRQALQVSSLYPLWAAGTSYGGKGESVIVRRPNGYLYRCREPHTAQAGWEPETTAALWAAIQGSQAGTPEDPIPAARGMEYQYGLYYLDPEDSQIYLCRAPGRRRAAKSSCNTSHTSWWGSILRWWSSQTTSHACAYSSGE